MKHRVPEREETVLSADSPETTGSIWVSRHTLKELALCFLTGFLLFWALVLLRSNHSRPGEAPAPASTVYGVF
jgi:hypothetical protein